ncbi:uncharacterized protein [Aegilops tauschii subsp. strangulata]|uniref:uncharacterized protein n=1 Tax=Aegilops tauschii subsp. strangulata TaxID=200361 RepID=UPI003CC86548
MDLERFGRALHLRWPWLQWTDPDRPWVGSELPCDQADLILFRACTTISLGNGEKALFWHDNWSGKGPLKLIAPELFKIASRKNRTVHEELSNESWIRAVSSLRSMHQLGEFVSIWEWISQTTLLPTNEDHISWNLTTNGAYSSASVYGAQFYGSHPRFNPPKVWSAHAKPKCKFFAWLSLHGRILTADRLALRGWPHDPRCQLCLQEPETASHLCKDCPFCKH